MARRWFGRKSLTCESEEFNVVVNALDRAKLNGYRILTTQDVTPEIEMGEIGDTPNANGGTISEGQLILQPASSSFGGLVTTGAQTFSGLKTFSGGISASGLITGVTTIGSTPNANGASISGSNLLLQPASASFGGVVTTSNQEFVGEKQFDNGIYLGSAQTKLSMYKETTITVGLIEFLPSFNASVPITGSPVVNAIYFGDQEVPNVIFKMIQIGKVVVITFPSFYLDTSGGTFSGLRLSTLSPSPGLTLADPGGNNYGVNIIMEESSGTDGWNTFTLVNVALLPNLGSTLSSLYFYKNHPATVWSTSASMSFAQSVVFYTT